MLRGGLAFLTAPFAPALFQSGVVALWPKEGMGVFENPPSMFVAVCIYYYVFGVLIGVPTFLLMRKRHTARLKVYATAGALVGLLPVGAALAWTAVQGSASAYVIGYNLLFFGLGGILAGLTFWLITRPRRNGMTPQAATR